jgi:SAM-dependent methyltransferase
VSKLTDRALVRDEYASEERLEARAAVFRWAEGPDAVEMCVGAVAEAAPRLVLDAGCGRGNIAERISAATGAYVVGLDQSERMVELTRARGVEAVVSDVGALPFQDGSFDCALAAWMLFHVEEVDQALAELARVEERLRRHFRTVERRDASGTLRFPDRVAAQAYVDASIALLSGELPDDLPEPFVVTRSTCVFVAET